ncbi:Tetratricopeptide repeat protein 37 [Anthophora plagiata]
MADNVKTLFNEARSLFKENKYTDVIKKCKKILKKDKNNYAVLVLLAAAMKKIDEYKSQVPTVLQRAIKIEENNPLAWKGLITYYEEDLDNDCCEKLIPAYCKILLLDSEFKFDCILSKILELSSQLKNIEVLTECVEYLIELRKTLEGDKLKLLDKTLGWILVDNSRNLDKYQDLLESVFNSVIDELDAGDQRKFCRKYLKALENGNVAVLLKEAVNVHKKFPQQVLPLQYICRIYYEQSMLDEDVNVEIAQFYESLIKLNERSEIAAIAKATHLRNSDNLTVARKTLKDALQLNPGSLYAWILLGEISAKLYCWEDAESAAKKALEIGKEEMKEELLRKVQFMLMESLSQSNSRQKWEAAYEMCEHHMKKRPSTRLELLHASLSVLLDKPTVEITLNDLLSNPETKIQATIVKASYLKRNKRYDEAISVLESFLETSKAWLLLGMIYWEMAEYTYSLMAFLKGVKADRYNWECLVYLGHYYREHGNDIERSRRCYQTALQINPNSEEAGIGLSTAYRLLKNQDANIALLKSLTVQDGGPKWAWLQLGLQYLDQGDAMQAIQAFQHVIRADPNDNHSWEVLGDAYFIRGAYTSALKSYERALDLCPNSLYPMIQQANIKLIVGQRDEAKTDFECILSTNPRYIPALKGLAETCLALGKECIKRKNVCCIWKLLGDVAYRVAILSEKHSHLKVSSILTRNEASEDIVSLKQRDLFLLSIRCYCYALSLSPHSALLWHDLALCYFMQLQLDPTVNHESLASKCLAAGKHAVKLSPSMWLHWNLLGVICMSPYVKNYALAQHAFVMAIDKELNNAIVWSNLGTLYLCIGKLYKANEAYSHAQRIDPTYINSWIGQALIAECMNRKEVTHLFSHATQLGYHNQAAVGYTHAVFNVILNNDTKDPLNTYLLENMHAVVAVTDVMASYVEHQPNDCYAHNAYGLLLERQKLYKSAAEQFAAALCISTNDEKDLVCVNLARVLIRLRKYTEAIKLCQTVKRASYNSECHLALALFKAEQYEESYSAYERTLQLYANTDEEKSYTLCAMAAIAYTFRKVHDAKILLFQCIQIQPPVITGLLAAASLGILHRDVNLTTLVLNELKSYENDPEYGHHVVNLSAYFHLLGNDVKSATVTLSKAIFVYPDDVKRYMRLLRLLFETDLQTFSKCAEKVLYLSKNVPIEKVAHVACALAFSRFTQNSEQKNMRALQKLLFTYPGNIESWATFVAAFLWRYTSKNCKIDSAWLLAVLSMMQRNYQPSDSMAKWLKDSKLKLEQLNQCLSSQC